MMNGSDEPSARGKAIKIGLVVVLLGAAGVIAYTRSGSGKVEQLDTAETATTYVCVECSHSIDLTAAQYAEMVAKNHAEQPASKEPRGDSALRCPNCQKPALGMGVKCPKDGTAIPLRTKDGKTGRCKKCNYSPMGQ